jgi:DNA polymerase-4
MDRIILHSDLNNFYACVECLYNPQLRDKPVAVGGDVCVRHGVVLAKNDEAKKFGVKTGEALWQAKSKCKNLIILPPDFQKYIKFSKLAREIYAAYTNLIEPFGPDECWLDITGGVKSFKQGEYAATEIRERIRRELGITASVGVSFNKIFAKLGSDMKKPDATTVISRENFKETVWRLPVNELLYVGRSTCSKLKSCGINTISDIAAADPVYLSRKLGKRGHMLWVFANGYDTSPVADINAPSQIKSIGNSTTAPRDLACFDDALVTIYVLCESVAARLRTHNLLCDTVQLYVRDNTLKSFERQSKLNMPTSNSGTLAKMALEILKNNYNWEKAVRSIGVCACHLVAAGDVQQSFLPEHMLEIRHDSLECAIDDIRRRFGHDSVRRGLMLKDSSLSSLNPKEDHAIFPVSYLK